MSISSHSMQTVRIRYQCNENHFFNQYSKYLLALNAKSTRLNFIARTSLRIKTIEYGFAIHAIGISRIQKISTPTHSMQGSTL